MRAPAIHIRSRHDRSKLNKFLTGIRFRSASIATEGDTRVWLLKSDDRGGPTVGRIIVLVDEPDVDTMVEHCFRESCAS